MYKAVLVIGLGLGLTGCGAVTTAGVVAGTQTGACLAERAALAAQERAHDRGSAAWERRWRRLAATADFVCGR